MKRSVSTRSVIAAQRRVLRLVRSYVGSASPKERAALRTDGKGLMTFDEVLAHVDAALKLRAMANTNREVKP